MRKLTIYFFLAIGILARAQEKPKNKPEFGVSAYMFSGNAILKQQSEVDQNSFIREGVSLEFDVKWDGLGIFTGIGTYQLTANRVLNGQSTFLKNDYLFIPVGITTDYPILKDKGETKLGLQFDFGGYAGHLFKTQENTTELTRKEKNVGWNFGLIARIGASYKLYDQLEMKVGIQSLTDLSKINTQKISKSTMYFISVGYRF